jgi:uncharacterized protein (DUF362 family)
MYTVCITRGKDPYITTKKLLDKLKFKVTNKKVLVKPNLVTTDSSGSGITTDVNVVRAILERLKRCEVTIAEGSSVDTLQAFESNGYVELAEEFDANLVDLNRDEVVIKKVPKPICFRKLPIAKAVLESEFLINVAKLKIHKIAIVTLCLKNLFGCVPGRDNKLVIHPSINKAICDIAQVIRPDFNVVDGIVGNQTDEAISSPVHSGIVVGGYDALSVDLVGSECMGVYPEEVEHLTIAKKLFGERKIKVIGEKIEDVKKIYDRKTLLKTRLRYAEEKILSKVLRGIKSFEKDSWVS